MKHHAPQPRDLSSLEAFVGLLIGTGQVRTRGAAAILAGQPVPPDVLPALNQALADLEAAGGRDGRAALEVAEDQTVVLDVAEETRQLRNDVLYLEQGREALFKQLSREHHGFREAVKRGLRLVTGLDVSLLWIEADGGLRAPGQRRRTAVQPVWQAVALGRFLQARAGQGLVWSAGPLSGPGGLETLFSLPPALATLAGSLGREWRNVAGGRGLAPLSEEKVELLAAMGGRLGQLLADPVWRAMDCVGSGLEVCRGVIRVARQDALGSVDPDTSLGLLEHVHDIVDAVDPERIHFRVRDNGLEVSVLPTGAGEEGSGDVSCGEGVELCAAALGCDLGRGPVLLCCGGSSGLALLDVLAPATPDLHCLFVSDRSELAERAQARCPGAVGLPHPDILAAVLSAAAL